MLINTVLLFLQNALPIFIITTLLLLKFPLKLTNKDKMKWLLLALVLTALSAFILSANLENISQTVEGKGVELLYSLGLLLVYCASITLFMRNITLGNTITKMLSAFVIFFIISCLNGAQFITYLTSYWAQAQQIESMLIGIILGGGICLSIAILFYFLLRYTDQKIYPATSNYFLLFFIIGQLMHAIILLQQVDILPSSQPFWDSSKFIDENSELGQLLTVLFGYESTPSFLQLIIYIIAFIIPVMFRNSKVIFLSLRGEQT